MKLVSIDNLPISKVNHDAEVLKRIMLDEGDLPGGVRFSEAVFPQGECISAHSHPDLIEVFYFTEGQGYARVSGKTCIIQKGTCLKVDQNEVHEIHNTGSEPLRVIYFSLIADV